MECSYCKKTYASNSSLFHHQRTAKSCMKIQEQQGIETKHNFKCSYCSKQLTSRYNLDNHLSLCKMKMKEDILKNASLLAEKRIQNETKKIREEKEDELEEVSFVLRNEKEQLEYELNMKIKELQEKDMKIKELQEKLEYHEKYPKKTKITNNTIHQNITNIFEVMTPDRVDDFFKKNYNIHTLMQGIPGMARFLNDHFIVKSSYICTDRSRHKFIMIDKHGNSVEDTNCKNLLTLTAPGMKHVKDVYETSIFDHHDDFTEEDIHNQYLPITSLDKDPSPLKTELSKIVPNEPILFNPDEITNVFDMLRDSYQKNVEKKVSNETPILQTIGGISCGMLQKYKNGYRERKQKSNGEEVEIKGPESLMKLYQNDPLIKKQYDQFIKS